MKKKIILITGSAGLLGSSLVKLFLANKWQVIGVDNDMRKKIFGRDGSTVGNHINHVAYQRFCFDIRQKEKMIPLVKRADAIVHAAAQPSHPKSLKIPMKDFQINVLGTLTLLELVRKFNHKIPFCFISSNKVYGDSPNKLKYQIKGKRYVNSEVRAFAENLPLDKNVHTPFGVSKLAADLYCQEYAFSYGLKTVIFRAGCITGSCQKAIEDHGFLGYLTKKILFDQKLKIFGGGNRVRDNIHADDFAEIIYLWINKPKPDKYGNFGQVYNVGGQIGNSVSIFEAIDIIEKKTGLKPKITHFPARIGDHLWWISDMKKFKKDYPEWTGLKHSLDSIFNELLENWIELSKK